jgi:hypothetical protein
MRMCNTGLREHSLIIAHQERLGRFLADYGLMRDLFKPSAGARLASGGGGGPSD